MKISSGWYLQFYNCSNLRFHSQRFTFSILLVSSFRFIVNKVPQSVHNLNTITYICKLRKVYYLSQDWKKKERGWTDSWRLNQYTDSQTDQWTLMSRNASYQDSMLFRNKHHKVSFSCYFIFDRILCVLVTFLGKRKLCDAYHI